jgi:hypothetical protein
VSAYRNSLSLTVLFETGEVIFALFLYQANTLIKIITFSAFMRTNEVYVCLPNWSHGDAIGLRRGLPVWANAM